jgi:endoglucanase
MGSGLIRGLRWLTPAAAVAGVAVAVALLLLAQASSRAASVPLSIAISGNHFVNGAGQTIRLLGVNHASSEYACVDGFGYNDGHQDAADAAAIASWHANAVRVPLNEDCWLGINGQPNNNEDPGETLTASGYRQAVESYVGALNAQGLYAILDLHWTAPGTQVAEEQQPMPDSDHSPAFWQSVATTFKSDPAVVFDLFNEPFDPTDLRSGTDPDSQDKVTWNCWDTGTENGPGGGTPCVTAAYDENENETSTYQVAGLQTLLNTIRSTGATQPVLAGGLNYANDLSQWATHAPDDPLNQEAASFHNYQGQDCDDVSCWNSTIAPIAANVPVVTGEFDEDNFDNASCGNRTPTTFDSDYMTWADQHGVSYLANGWELLTPDEVSQEGCSAYVLTSDYAGTPAPPNGTVLHDHLTALATAQSSAPTTTTPTTTTTTTKTATTTTPGGGSNSSHKIKLNSFKIAVRPGAATVGFTLRAARSCSGTLTAQTLNTFAVTAAKRSRPARRRVSLGTVHFKLAANRSKSVVLRLSMQAKRLLVHNRSLRVRITITLGAGATRSVTQRKVTLRVPPVHKRKG